jgi:hypothetical protein
MPWQQHLQHLQHVTTCDKPYSQQAVDDMAPVTPPVVKPAKQATHCKAPQFRDSRSCRLWPEGCNSCCAVPHCETPTPPHPTPPTPDSSMCSVPYTWQAYSQQAVDEVAPVTPPVVKPAKQATHWRCLRRPLLHVSAGHGAADGVADVSLLGMK